MRLSLGHRTRSEFRFFDHKDEYTRLRQEFTSPLLEVHPAQAATYIEEEVFYYLKKIGSKPTGLEVALLSSWDGAKFKLGYRLNKYRIGGDFRTRHTIVSGLNLFF